MSRGQRDWEKKLQDESKGVIRQNKTKQNTDTLRELKVSKKREFQGKKKSERSIVEAGTEDRYRAGAE